MTTWILLAVRAGIILTVLALGLRASFDDATFLVRRPTKLGKALLSMNVVMPLFAAAMISMFALQPVVKIALLTLAVSPIPPFLPSKALRVGGDAAYTIGLLVAASVLAIVFVPLSVELLGVAFRRSVQVSVSSVVLVMATTVLAPLAVGLLVHRLAPTFAARSAKPVSIVGLVVLVASVIPIAVVAMPDTISLIGDGTLLALTAFVVVGLVTGHLLGGPERGERTVLALTTSSRHPGIALAIASANFTDHHRLLSTILLYLIVTTVVSIPYSIASKPRRAKTLSTPHGRPVHAH